MNSPEPTRYLTRARAKATTNTTNGLSSLPTRRVPEKRKARLDASGSGSEGSGIDKAATRGAQRPAKKPAMSTKTAGASGRPRRNVTTVNGHSLSKMAPATKPAKTVTFAVPVDEDKENMGPGNNGRPTATKGPLAAPAALDAKPKRKFKSKLKPPSGSEMGDVPALSPKKAVRLPKAKVDENDDMVDELLCPTSPGLSGKPKQILPPTKKDALAGASLLQSKAPAKGSVLFGSPARRVNTSPMRVRTDKDVKLGSTLSKSTTNVAGLSSPAKRLPGTSKKTGTKSNGTAMHFSVAVDDEDPFVDGCMEDMSEDELSLPTRPVERKIFGPAKSTEAAKTDDDIFGPSESSNFVPVLHEMDAEVVEQKIAALAVQFPVSPPSPKESVIPESVSTPTQPPATTTPFLSPLSDTDADGDIDMDEIAYAPAQLPQATEEPKATTELKKHRSPSEGGSSYGFFAIEDDEDDGSKEDHENVENAENVIPHGTSVAMLAEQFGGVELSRHHRRSFGRALEIPQTDFHNGIPIDPFLLAEEPEPIVYLESPVPSMIVPVKFDDSEPQQAPPMESHDPAPHARDSHRKRRISGIIRPLSPVCTVLAGAVVFVDAHLNDGANASEAFQQKLKSLGARVLKQWSWNPDSQSPSNKIGITHVVFKEGSPRTLQKVKRTGGVVTCVGLAWVLACQERQEWVDENDYLVDLDMIPRGGARRRKSMEPKALDALVRSCSNALQTPSTPAPTMHFEIPRTEPLKGHPGSDLLEQAALVRKRLQVVRRKSLQFAPKVGSPLARGGWTLEE